MNTLPGMSLTLVTGAGRRQGIGAAICRALAAAGYGIFFTHWQSYDQSMPWSADDNGPAALEEEIRAMGIATVGRAERARNPFSRSDDNRYEGQC